MRSHHDPRCVRSHTCTHVSDSIWTHSHYPKLDRTVFLVQSPSPRTIFFFLLRSLCWTLSFLFSSSLPPPLLIFLSFPFLLLLSYSSLSSLPLFPLRLNSSLFSATLPNLFFAPFPSSHSISYFPIGNITDAEKWRNLQSRIHTNVRTYTVGNFCAMQH